VSFSRLPLLARQKAWWRLLALPALLALVVLLQWYATGRYMLSQAVVPATSHSLRDVLFVQPQPLAPRDDSQEGPEDQPGIPLSGNLTVMVITALVTWLGSPAGHNGVSQLGAHLGGAMAPLTTLVVTVHFMPFLLAVLVLLGRLMRLTYARFCGVSGMFLDVSSAPAYTWQNADFVHLADAPLNRGLAYLRVMEEVVTNAMVAVLHEHAIDTSSVKEATRLFVNNGIYMTGGTVESDIIQIGKSARFFGRWKRKAVTHGRRSVMDDAPSVSSKRR